MGAYGKRSAEAAPEASADPYLLYGGYGLGYGHGYYGGYYGHGLGYYGGYGVYGKRSAEAAPEVRPTPTFCTVATTATASAMATAMEPDTASGDKLLVSPCLGFVSINPL